MRLRDSEKFAQLSREPKKKKRGGGGAKKKGKNFCCLFSKEGEPSLDCRDKFLSIAVYLERLIVYIEMYVCMFVCF